MLKKQFICMTFRCYYDSVPAKIGIDFSGVALKRVENVKLLGKIIIDYKLCGFLKVQHITKRLRYFIFIIYKFR